MIPIVIRNKQKPIMMEVIGENGLKIAEYVDKGDKKLPYYKVVESVQNVV